MNIITFIAGVAVGYIIGGIVVLFIMCATVLGAQDDLRTERATALRKKHPSDDEN